MVAYQPGHNANGEAALVAARCPRSFWPLLLGIIVAGGLLRLLILSEYLDHNPFASFLRVDALTYWNWAGRIAAGQLGDSQPFFSAPLYPYLLGLARSCGGGLPTVYALQIVLDLATAGMLALIGRTCFGPAVGLLAAGLFLLMLEPASFSLRILTATLQLALICLAWLLLLRGRDTWSLQRGLWAGAALGLLALAYPPAILLLPVFGGWWWWNARGRRGAVGRAALVVAAGAVVISPAAIHNYLASGEFFAIQAVSGLTLRQGNGPGARGGIVMIPGTSADRETLFRSALDDYRRTHDQQGTWSDVDRHYRREVLTWWLADPPRALRLFAMKGYWLLTGCNYSEIYMPTTERAEGLLARLWLTPVQTAWLLPVALVGVVVWLRRPNVNMPALAIFGLVLLVTVVFRYSPRYRSPAIPVVVIAAAWGLCQAVRWRRRTGWTISVAAAALLTLGLQLVNRAVGFDALATQRPLFEQSLAAAAAADGELERALRHYREALRLRPDLDDARLDLAETLRTLGRLDEAAEQAAQVLTAAPESARAHTTLGLVLIGRRDVTGAAEHFRHAVEIAPHDAAARVNLGNALSQRGLLSQAIEQYQAALRVNPASAAAAFNLGRARKMLGESGAAISAFGQALRLDPGNAAARRELAYLLAQRGDYAEAAGHLRQAHRVAPDDVRTANDLAWLLATCPAADVRGGAEAVQLAQAACAGAGQPHVNLLDTLAAALAEAGRYDEALQAATQAQQLAEHNGAVELAEAIRLRAELYRARQPYREQ